MAGRGEERRRGKRPSELQREEGLFPSGHLDPLWGQGQGINPGSLCSSGALCKRPYSSSWGARGGPRSARCGRIRPAGLGDAPRRPGTAPAGCWGANRDAYGAKGILASSSTPKKIPFPPCPEGHIQPGATLGPKMPQSERGPSIPMGAGALGWAPLPRSGFRPRGGPPGTPKRGREPPPALSLGDWIRPRECTALPERCLCRGLALGTPPLPPPMLEAGAEHPLPWPGTARPLRASVSPTSCRANPPGRGGLRSQRGVGAARRGRGGPWGWVWGGQAPPGDFGAPLAAVAAFPRAFLVGSHRPPGAQPKMLDFTFLPSFRGGSVRSSDLS